jgi:hypothetical protein
MSKKSKKPTVFPHKQIRQQDISPIMRPAAPKVATEVCSLRAFLTPFLKKDRLPLLFQLQYWHKGTCHISDLSADFKRLFAQEVTIRAVNGAMRQYHFLQTSIQEADLFVVHWQQGPKFTVKCDPPSEYLRALLIGSDQICVIEIGRRGNLPIEVLREIISLHSWQVFGHTDQVEGIPAALQKIGLDCHAICLWRPFPAKRNCIWLQFEQTGEAKPFHYPLLWLIAVKVFYGAPALSQPERLREFAQLNPAGRCPHPELENRETIATYLTEVGDNLPASAPSLAHGFRIVVSKLTWDGSFPPPPGLGDALGAPLAANSQFSFITRNAEKDTHMIIQVMLIGDASGQMLQGVIIKHHGPLQGPLLSQ